MKQAKQIIESTNKERACVFFSGGIDSLVLLYLLKDYELPVISFTSDWKKEDKKKLEQLIFDWNLTLYTYPIKNRYIVPNEGSLSLIDEYGFAGFDLPVIRDITESDTCLADLSKERFTDFDFGFDTVFTGILKEDENFGTNWFDVQKQQGKINFVSPLFDWTKGEIQEFAKEKGLTELVIDSNEISVCTKCLHGKETFCPAEQRVISPVDFDGQKMLGAYREKYELHKITV